MPPVRMVPVPYCPRAGAGRGSDDGRALQPGAGSVCLRCAWCRYHIARVPERVGEVMTGVLSSRELGAYASGAHGAGTIAGGRSQAQAPAPGGIHGRPG